MDYIEIMNFCGYDLNRAHELAKRRGAEDFSETVKKMRGLTGPEQEERNVHLLSAESCAE